MRLRLHRLHPQGPRCLLRLAVKAPQAVPAAMGGAKAVPVAGAVKAVPEVQADGRAANGNFSARRKSASSAWKRST